MLKNQGAEHKMKVNCPTCKAQVEWHEASEYRPFCSKKCQLIDFGEWANEEKAIPCAPNVNAQMEQIDVEDIEALLAQQEQDFFK
jgi:endogenous inhibitor of DNA gyrase (YacG/DUF329 family)